MIRVFNFTYKFILMKQQQFEINMPWCMNVVCLFNLLILFLIQNIKTKQGYCHDGCGCEGDHIGTCVSRVAFFCCRPFCDGVVEVVDVVQKLWRHIIFIIDIDVKRWIKDLRQHGKQKRGPQFSFVYDVKLVFGGKFVRFSLRG